MKKFEFDAEFLYASNPVFRSLRTAVRTNRHRFTFNASADQTSLKQRVLEILRIADRPGTDTEGDSTRAGPTSSGSTSRRYARVEGVDPEGNERAFRLQNNPDSFGDTDYDDMVQYGTIDAKQVLQSPIIGWILERVGENRQHFETDVP